MENALFKNVWLQFQRPPPVRFADPGGVGGLPVDPSGPDRPGVDLRTHRQGKRDRAAIADPHEAARMREVEVAAGPGVFTGAVDVPQGQRSQRTVEADLHGFAQRFARGPEHAAGDQIGRAHV